MNRAILKRPSLEGTENTRTFETNNLARNVNAANHVMIVEVVIVQLILRFEPLWTISLATNKFGTAKSLNDLQNKIKFGVKNRLF